MKEHIEIEEAVWQGDDTPYRRLGSGALAEEGRPGSGILRLDPEELFGLSRQAFRDLSFFLRPGHLDQLAAIAADQGASPADRFVAASLLRNAAISGEGVLPLCQDTGTATIMAWRGEGIVSGADEARALASGARHAYLSDNLRFSQLSPESMYGERDTRDNMPAQVDICHSSRPGYRFLFVAKGGGSSNKTSFFQETKALLNPTGLEAFLRQNVRKLGTSACPPYHIAMVLGGTSPEHNLKVLKLASAGALDRLPDSRDLDPEEASGSGIFRDSGTEALIMDIARGTGLGAQFGGANLALDARVVRLPRHAASCPVSLGVSCVAHRNLRGYISREGVFLEELERDPGRYLRGLPGPGTAAAPRVDLGRPMSEIRKSLEAFKAGDLVLLSGSLIVARDAAHARLHQMLSRGEELPEWFRSHPVCYAGPAETPPGRIIGSFGPTTAGRMDGYVGEFMAKGASYVMLAKGNRSEEVRAACERHRGTYLGTIGGAAALIASEHITANRLVAFPELGMEAVRLIEVRDLPAFVIIDSRGRDLYSVAQSRNIG